MSYMKAVRFYAYGSRDVLTYEDAPRPTPGAGDVLIRVAATSVNPFDCAVRAGYLSAMIPVSFPAILGTDVSGTVEAVGPDVNTLKPGDSVYTRAGIMRDGAYAEYVLANAADVVARPRTLDHIQTAALPHVSLTAWQALFEVANLSKGQTVLIHGAGGGVGHVAVQLAHWRGARVIGTASRSIDLVKSLKVDQAIDYSTTRFEEVVKDVDVVLDTIGGDTQERSWGIIKPGGILVSIIQPPSAEKAAAHQVRQAYVYSSPPVGKTLTELAALVDAGLVRPHVSAVLPLADIRRAHELVESGHTRGKLVIQVA